MDDRTLVEVKKKFVELMQTDPPLPVVGMPREPLAPIFDRWVARRFSPDEVSAIFHYEMVYGQRALSDWFAEVLVEAGQLRARRLAT